MTSSLQRQRVLPWLAAAVLAAAALGLTLHTAVSRHERLLRARAETAKGAVDSPDPGPRPSHGSGSGSNHGSGSSSVQSLTPEQREKAVAKRVTEVLSIANPLDQMRALLRLMENFSSEDFRVALKTCDAFYGNADARNNMAVAYEWTLRFPAEALAFLREDNRLQMRRQDCLSYLLAQDEEAALRLVRSHSDADQRRVDLSYLLPTVTQTHPERTVEILEEMPIADQIRAAGQLSSRASAATFVELGRWAETQTDPKARKQAILQMCEEANPKAVAEQMALMQRHPEAMPEWNIGYFLTTWSSFDPAAAATALAQVPEGEPRKEAVGRMALQLAQARHGDLAQGLMERYPETVDDSLRAEVAKSHGFVDASAALGQIEKIDDAFLRDRTAADILDDWLRRDPFASWAWLEKHGVSDAVRQKMTRPFPTRPPGS